MSPPTTTRERYDVVVCGGGVAGVAAACGAAATGARTLLVERASVLGGAATLRNVLGICGLSTCGPHPRRAVGGIAEMVLTALRGLNGVTDLVTVGADHWAVVFLDPEATISALDRVCMHHGVDIVLGATVVDVDRGERDITGVAYTDFFGTRVDVDAGAVVDATGDSTITALAGARVTLGAAGRVQTATMAMRFGGIDATADISPASVGAAVQRRRAAGHRHLTSSSGFVMRLPISGDVVTYLADAEVNPLDSRSYSAATRSAREQSWAYLEAIRQLPGCAGAYLVSTGPEMGVRQSRHMDSRQPLSDTTLRDGTITAQAVALAAWPSEFHPGVGLPSQWVPIGGPGAYEVTVDNLRSADTDNLFGAGRVLGGDRRAGASVRVLGTSFATGHAAGVAAALHTDTPPPPPQHSPIGPEPSSRTRVPSSRWTDPACPQRGLRRPRDPDPTGDAADVSARRDLCARLSEAARLG